MGEGGLDYIMFDFKGTYLGERGCDCVSARTCVYLSSRVTLGSLVSLLYSY